MQRDFDVQPLKKEKSRGTRPGVPTPALYGEAGTGVQLAGERAPLISATRVFALMGVEVDDRTANRRLRGVSPSRLPYYPCGRDRRYKTEDAIKYIESLRVN